MKGKVTLRVSLSLNIWRSWNKRFLPNYIILGWKQKQILNQDWGLWKDWVFYHCLSKIVICRSNFTNVGHLIEDPQDFLNEKLITDVATSNFNAMKWKLKRKKKKREREREIRFVGGPPFKIRFVKPILIKSVFVIL